MKRAFFAFSMLTSGILAIPSHASAQCVQAAVGVQAAITGSLTPAEQTSNVQMYAPDSCSGGNYQGSDTVQTAIGGTGPVRQNWNATQVIEPGYGGDNGLHGGPAIQVPATVSVDVYNYADQYLQ